MPLTRNSIPNTMIIYELDGPDVVNPRVNPIVSKQTILVSERTWPNLVQRARPKDLFMNGTSRTTVGETWVPKTIRWRNCNYSGCRLYTSYNIWDAWAYWPLRARYSDYACTKPLNDPSTSIDRNAMYNSIRGKLKNEATNLANMLGEYRETAQTFLDIAKIVATNGGGLVKRHKSGAKRGRVSVGQTAAQNRLAWEYGVRPLAGDVGTAMAELRSAILARPPMKEGTVRRKSSMTNIGYKSANSTIYSGRATSELKAEVIYRTRWRAYMNQNALLLCLAEHGMLNPASVAWELMPYSFVADWFFNVGDILSSLDNLLICDKLMVIDSSSTKYFEYTIPVIDAQTLTTATAFYAKRTDVRSAPAEISRVSSLQYKPSLSLGHILNGLALLYVAKGRP